MTIFVLLEKVNKFRNFEHVLKPFIQQFIENIIYGILYLSMIRFLVKCYLLFLFIRWVVNFECLLLWHSFQWNILLLILLWFGSFLLWIFLLWIIQLFFILFKRMFLVQRDSWKSIEIINLFHVFRWINEFTLLHLPNATTTVRDIIIVDISLLIWKICLIFTLWLIKHLSLCLFLEFWLIFKHFIDLSCG